MKKALLKEKEPKNHVIIREGWHLVMGESGGFSVLRVLTTSGIALSKESVAMDYLPVSAYVPTGDDDETFPFSWYSGMLSLDREINDVISKFKKIVDTGGRYVYVRKGTKISQGTDKFLNKL